MNKINLSEEQQYFVDKAVEGHNILVNACIGSGKTTAIQLLCNTLPENKNILYLTYNRLLKLDAQSKIVNQNVTVQNYHGIAYAYLRKMRISTGVSDLIGRFNKEKPRIDKYHVLIIDEYQDIETEFAELLEHIKASNPKMQIIAVGDMQQKIYDKTSLNVSEFINQFLGKHLELEFTQCFRLSADLASKLGRIWCKKIEGVNPDCSVEEMNIEQVTEFLATQDTKDVLCLGARTGALSKTLNILESEYPEKFNKQTVYASISDNDSLGKTNPTPSTAIFTTFDSSKGLERKICVIFDYTESYWEVRVTKPQQSFEILRNIFCVAASRGKNRIIFVNSGEGMLSEATLSTKVNENQKIADMAISSMFDFKYRENIESCYALLQTKPVFVDNHSAIEVKNKDGLIDLSPCVGIYQEAMYFSDYDIDKDIEMRISFYDDNKISWIKSIWAKNFKKSSLENKILFLVSLETRQERYRTQVELPFIGNRSKNQIADRLSERLQRDENVQVDCNIKFSNRNRGTTLFSAKGYADVVKDGVVYELKFVSELTHEHFLQCACYMVALGLEKGILWNTRDNTAYEITVPDKKKFLDEVVKTVTKNKITAYYQPNSRKAVTQKPIENADISGYSVKTKIYHKNFGSGVIMKIEKIAENTHIIEVKFRGRQIQKFHLEALISKKLLVKLS